MLVQGSERICLATDAALCADGQGLRLHPKPMSSQRTEPNWPFSRLERETSSSRQIALTFVLFSSGGSIFLHMEHIFMTFFNK